MNKCTLCNKIIETEEFFPTKRDENNLVLAWGSKITNKPLWKKGKSMYCSAQCSLDDHNTQHNTH